MLNLRLGPGILLGVLLSGCGGQPSPLIAGGPHSGVMIKLPESKGYAELVFEPLARKAPRSAPTEPALYFLGPDRASPLSPLPTGVTLDLLDPDSRRTVSRPLGPSPKAGDPVGSARFATGPIDVDHSQFPASGELKADLGGPIRVAF